MRQWIAVAVIFLGTPAAPSAFAQRPASAPADEAGGRNADEKVEQGAEKKEAPDRAARLAEAKRLLQNGRYAEAEENYGAIEGPARGEPSIRVPSVLGKAEAQAAQGKYAEAVKELEILAGAADLPAARRPDVLARIAELLLARGRWEEAETRAREALQADADHLLGRWIEARLFDLRGEFDKGTAACKWFVDHYNDKQADLAGSAESLLLVGQAAERYYRASARGEELSDSLNDVINEIYEGALRADPNCWQAPWLEGRLFLSGYNERAATRELARARQINPLAPEVLTTLGQADLQGYRLSAGRSKVEQALAVNPHYTPAHVLLADLNISDERFVEAEAAARKAAAENPRDEDALARLAAAHRLLVDPFGAAAAEAAARTNNPRPATFYAALGERLADRRKYHSAERAFLLGIAADPARADSPIGLGMLYMQIGREDEAKALFDSAFAADPFNVRADNMMKVLRHMASYVSIETEHFRVLIDPAQDALTGKYMARYLESVYDELVNRFGYAPPAKTQIEIMKNHQWFSGRTIGLPFIPTVGACTGKVVALSSPRAAKQPFNWARVLKHEVVHVITLQQTEFNIPHWYTEALAVESEGYPRPQTWNRMLLERVPARSRLLNLDTINLGFIRPDEPEDRQMAYCQAQLYARYMLKRFGPDALIKMLDAYRRGLTTDRAVERCFHVGKADFEKGYLEFLDAEIKSIRTRVNEEPPIKFSELERRVKAKPDDPELNARMAYEHLARRDLKEARPFAEKALKLKPRQPLASYVKARMLTMIGDDEAALALLEPALDPGRPNERVVDLLAELTLKAKRLDDAERLYELARKDDPYHTKWIAGLARVHLRQKKTDKFLEDLALIADNDADDLAVRKALAERKLAAGRFDEAAKWAVECIYIDVHDPAVHLLLADAESARRRYGAAVEEYKTALELKPKKPNDVRVRLARAQLGQGRPDDAAATLRTVLKEDPEHPEAQALAKEIEKPAAK